MNDSGHDDRGGGRLAAFARWLEEPVQVGPVMRIALCMLMLVVLPVMAGALVVSDPPVGLVLLAMDAAVCVRVMMNPAFWRRGGPPPCGK